MATVTEKRDVHDFKEVALQGYGDLVITQNPDAPESLEIEADQDILSRITSQVRNGRLILGFDMPWYDWLGWGLEWLFTTNKSIHYRLSLKQVNSVALSGSASLTADRLQSEGLKLVVSGSGKVRLGEVQAGSLGLTISGSGDIEVAAGSAPKLDLMISGSGRMRTADVETQDAHVTISGSGNAQVAASQTLTVHISGSGDVKYRGSPQVNQSISGAGSIKQL